MKSQWSAPYDCRWEGCSINMYVNGEHALYYSSWVNIFLSRVRPSGCNHAKHFFSFWLEQSCTSITPSSSSHFNFSKGHLTNNSMHARSVGIKYVRIKTKAGVRAKYHLASWGKTQLSPILLCPGQLLEFWLIDPTFFIVLGFCFHLSSLEEM